MVDFQLERFVVAQEDGEAFDHALEELRSGRKRTHWMWFVFPQIAGLGQSATSRHFAISGLEEAQAYLAHTTLGPRLRECCRVLLGLTTLSAEQVFGSIDAMKLRSSMTLFCRAAPDDRLFHQVLERFFGGVPDEATDDRL